MTAANASRDYVIWNRTWRSKQAAETFFTFESYLAAVMPAHLFIDATVSARLPGTGYRNNMIKI